MEQHIIEENSLLSGFVSNQIETRYSGSDWPFESLHTLSAREGFLFWWVVDDDGVIRLADNASFMETRAMDYFPEVTRAGEQGSFLNHDDNYGIFVSPFKAGKEDWSFWLGISLTGISKMRKDLLQLTIISSLLLALMLGIILYFSINYFTRPIQGLTRASEEIARGNLDHEVRIKTKDEVGELAQAFEDMRLGIKDRNDLLDSLLSTFKGKFGNIATIIVSENIRRLADKNPRILNIIPTQLAGTIKKRKELEDKKGK
jgi:HAMP domain-containing protein